MIIKVLKIQKKNFLNFKLNENIFLFVCLNEKDELCAFDICYEINNILYTPIVAWDYINPKLSILTLFYSEEIKYCMQNNIPFLYGSALVINFSFFFI